MDIKETGRAEEGEGSELRSMILARLAEHGIGEVRIEFDGSGDEGQVEGISCTKIDGTPGSLDWPCNIPGKVRPAVTSSGSPRMGEGASAGEARPMTMRELLDDWAYELLDDVGVDWVNSEGGFGEIIIMPAEDAVRCEMNVRVIEANYSEHEL
jgi:hypothetical protein